MTGDPRTYSSASGVAIPSVHGILSPPIAFDPPEHTAYRKIIQRQFTRQGAARYEPLLRRLVQERLTEVIDQGSADVVPTLARYLPPMAIAAILGLLPEDGERFVEWTARFLVHGGRGRSRGDECVTQEFTAYISDHLDRACDEETTIGVIDRGRFNGRPLSPQERLGMILLLIIAGHETTVNSIATMMYHIATVDGLKDRLIAEALQFALQGEVAFGAFAHHRVDGRDGRVVGEAPFPLQDRDKVVVPDLVLFLDRDQLFVEDDDVHRDLDHLFEDRVGQGTCGTLEVPDPFGEVQDRPSRGVSAVGRHRREHGARHELCSPLPGHRDSYASYVPPANATSPTCPRDCGARGPRTR